MTDSRPGKETGTDIHIYMLFDAFDDDGLSNIGDEKWNDEV